MIGSAGISELVPHQGRMCLLERIEWWDDSIVVATTGTHRDPVHPLRSAGRLSSVHLCEYGAQAMALHGGLLARAAGRAPAQGMLVSLREVRWHAEFIDDLPDDLVVSAEQLHATPSVLQYRFEVRHAGALLALGRLAAITLLAAGDSTRELDFQRQF